MLLSALLGTPVFRSGQRIGTLADLGVVPSPRLPVVIGIVVRPPAASGAWVRWSAVERLDGDTVVLAPNAPLEPLAAPVLLARDVLDAQIVDLAGHHVVRVGDVELEPSHGALHVDGIEVGLASVLRRLGLRRLARRAVHRHIAWTDLHLPSHPGATLTLEHALPTLRRLSPRQRGRLAARLPAHAIPDGAHHHIHRRFPTHLARRRAKAKQ